MAPKKKSAHVARTNQLSRERIGEAALELIDREGLAAFSARRLASDLRCEAMSLYHHVENMDDVLDLVVDKLLATLPSPPGNPRKALDALAQSYIELAETHPNAFALIATRRWRTANAIAAASASVGVFQALGVPQREALRRARILGAYLNGAGLALMAWRLAPSGDASAATSLGVQGALSAEAVRADLDTGLRRLLDMLSR